MNLTPEIEQQINSMRQFITFTNRTKLSNFLAYVGFFRASQYAKYLSNLSPNKPHQEELFELYRFDLNLRKLFFDYTKRVEIQFKTHLANGCYAKTQDPYFYINEENYTPSKGETNKGKKERNRANYDRHFIKNIQRLEKELRLDQSKHPELKQYRVRGYRTNYCIPAWALLDCCEFGSMMHIYAYLRGDLRKDVLKQGYSRKNYGKETTKQLDTWLTAIRHLRNSSAHHNRLIGRTSSIVLPEAGEEQLLTSQTDLFARIYALKKLLNSRDSVNLHHDLALLIKRTKLDIYALKALPPDWEQRYDRIRLL